MVLELVAQRIIAPHVGMSLYTWTCIIGVILAGISLGNYLGGRLADQWASPRLLGWIFVLGGLASLAILFVDGLDILAPLEWPFIAEILVLITALFFLPAAILGTVSPVAAKLAMRDLDRTGRAAGQIYAAGSAGSIAGTVVTGFLLVSWFSTHVIVRGVGGLLLLLGLFFLLRHRWQSMLSREGNKVLANRPTAGMMVKSRPGLPRPSWLWRPALVVFLSSACIMVLELVVGRIAASYVGMSLYTWTVVIAVVLAGISLGSNVGGRLADRWTSSRLLGGVLVLAGLASLSLLAVNVLEPLTSMKGITRENLPLIVGSAVFALAVCFLPSLVLGTVSPIVAKLAVRDLSRTGRTVGQIYAAGSVGSIVGTFVTGFFLISRFGTHAVVWGVGSLLILLGLLLLPERRRVWTLLWLLLVAGGSVAAVHWGWLDGPCTRETDYFCITVREQDLHGKSVRVLVLDQMIHSYSSLDDPTVLVYGYEQSYAEATAYQAARKGRLRALFIGGGGYTFPRYMETVYPASDLHVIEIDPGVTEVAHDMLGLSRDTQVVTFSEDARTFLKREPTGKYDLIFGDAFNSYAVPYHLTTKEFNDRVRAWLAEDGLYAVNIIDGPSGHFLRAYLHTLRQTFRHVYPVFSVDSWRLSPRSTIVILAGDTPLDLDAFQIVAPRSAPRLVSQQEIDASLTKGPPVTLTDRYAPVDQMLLPVFLDVLP
jgi:spermidine synthase/predicted MFS family arabinose efflux permease